MDIHVDLVFRSRPYIHHFTDPSGSFGCIGVDLWISPDVHTGRQLCLGYGGRETHKSPTKKLSAASLPVRQHGLSFHLARDVREV